MTVGRRAVMLGTGLLLTGPGIAERARAATPEDLTDDERELAKRLTGKECVLSARVRLDMPPSFGNGYSVPMSVAVDSPMTEADHVRSVQIVAPRNPIVVAAVFHFTPGSGLVALSTRVRLAEPQAVLALAEMSDGAMLAGRAWVKVDTNGCA